MKWQDQLTIWRKERNLVTPSDAFISMVDEEIEELALAASMDETIDALCDIIVLTENQAKLEGSSIDYSTRLSPICLSSLPSILLKHALLGYSYGEDNTSAFQELYNIAYTFISYYGYLPELAMRETVLEISSRQQSPAQALDWSTNGPSGKWLKDKSQDPTTLYTADYSKCRS